VHAGKLGQVTNWAHSMGHSGPLCHALSLSLWTSMRRRRATVQWRHLVNWRETSRCGEWAQHFSNASCFTIVGGTAKHCVDQYMVLFHYCSLGGDTVMPGGLHAS